jgi:hypothetical protein
MNDIILKDRKGVDQTYEGVKQIELKTPDGGTQIFGVGGVIETDIFSAHPLGGFEEDTGDFSGSSTITLNGQFVINADETYYVDWDGETYTCRGTYVELPNDAGEMMSYVYIGDGSRLGYPGNGEPFAMIRLGESSIIIVIALDSLATEHNIRIYQKEGGSAEEVDAILNEVDVRLDAINGGSVCIVTFIGADGKTLCVRTVQSGTDCASPIDTGVIGTPTKQSTEDYDYEFSGWSFTSDGKADENALKNITASITLYAAFKDIQIRGQVGSNIRWEISKPYTTLHFYGSGALEPRNGADYFDHSSTVTKIVFHNEDEGITTLGYMFCYVLISSFWKLENIEIPNTVKTIDELSFGYTSSLKQITIPSSVNYIGVNAFSSSGLVSVTFKTTSGWALYDAQTDARLQTLSSDMLADPAQAAQALVTDYKKYVWKRS